MQVTGCFLLREEKVCLAQKRRTYGIGLWNGYGGRVKDGEFVEACTIRETHEESSVHVSPDNLVKTAVVRIYRGGEFQYELHVFLARTWEGEPQESEEMGPPRWFRFNRLGALPLLDMFSDDLVWLPRALSGEKFEADAYLSLEGDATDRVVFRKATFR